MKNQDSLIKKLLTACSLSSFLLIAACAHSGNSSIKNETAESIDQKIHDGETTKAQVRSFFGDPLSVVFTDSGHEQWRYEFTKGSVDGTNFIPVYNSLHQGTHGNVKTLIIIFDKDKVWHHALSSSKVAQAHGVF